jgi:hypothetical protein
LNELTLRPATPESQGSGSAGFALPKKKATIFGPVGKLCRCAGCHPSKRKLFCRIPRANEKTENFGSNEECNPMTNTKTDRLADTLTNVLTSPNVSDSNGEPANLVDVFDRIGDALWRTAKWFDQLTPMEAIENHGEAVKEAAETIASAIHDLAAAIRERKDDRDRFNRERTPDA